MTKTNTPTPDAATEAALKAAAEQAAAEAAAQAAAEQAAAEQAAAEAAAQAAAEATEGDELVTIQLDQMVEIPDPEVPGLIKGYPRGMQIAVPVDVAGQLVKEGHAHFLTARA